MSLHTTEALILRTYKLNDDDRIVVFLTRDHGKKRGVAKGARSSKSRVPRGARADDARGWWCTSRRRIASWCRSTASICCDRRCPRAIPDALGYVGYLAELMDEWAQDSDPNEMLVSPRRRPCSTRWSTTG